MTNLGPSCALREVGGMGWAQPQSWNPPRTFGNCPVLGGKHGREEDGSGFRSFLRVRRVQLGFPAWLSQMPRLRSRPSRGCLWGGQQLLRAPSQRFGSGRWRWAAALLGSLSGSGGAGACPQLSPKSGRGRPAGSGLAGAARRPLLKSGYLTRAAPREPRLCAHRHPPPSFSR